MAIMLVLLVLFLMPHPASALPLVQNYFFRTGQSESLTTQLTVFGGTTTTQQWSDLIEVIVSGVGVNNPPTGLQVDPFWAFSPNDPSSVLGTGHRFRLSFTGCAASFECGAPDIALFMRFVEGVGFVNPPNVTTLDPVPLLAVMPILQSIVPYTTTHAYHFVMDVGPGAKRLTLGDGDGGVFDNSGHFTAQLFSVERIAALPEPSTLALFGSGVLLLATVCFRRNHTDRHGKK
jgi:hypothetical protein